MSYRYDNIKAQMGCDLSVCRERAVGYVEVHLKDQAHGGHRQVLHLAVCARHSELGHPVERVPVDDA